MTKKENVITIHMRLSSVGMKGHSTLSFIPHNLSLEGESSIEIERELWSRTVRVG